MMQRGLMWLAVGMLAALMLGQLAQALSPPVSDPRRELLAMTVGSPELGPALHRADRGDPGALVTWLTRVEPVVRQRLGLVLLGLLARSGPPGPDGAPLPDDRATGEARQRLAAFAAVSTGSPAVDHQLTNVLAYGLAAGDASPSAADTAFANQLADRLERRLAADPSHEVWDTVGCARFRAGRWADAKEAWTEAQELLAKEADSPVRALLAHLYQARRGAAERNLDPPPHTPPEPLPRDLRPGTVAIEP